MLIHSQSKLFSLFIAAGLTLTTVLIYGQTFHHEFIHLDVLDTLIENPFVRSGLSWNGIRWAFTNLDAGVWQPLTWISWMLDCQLFGLNAGAHHLMNAGIHLANVLLLFFWLRKITGSASKSAAVAFLFAVHPLRVESVAWAAERKDTLSAFFWLAALIAYSHPFISCSEPQKGPRPFWTKRGVAPFVLLLFTLGAMAKPMVVTLPLVLLLIDFWPLGRFEKETFRDLILEKWPLWLGSVAVAGASLWAGKTLGTLPSSELYSWSFRFQNVCVSYASYLGKTLVPIHLAIFYPLPTHHSFFAVTGALVLLLLVSVFAFRKRRTAPYFFTGWFWFLITLLPVIGIVQVGGQAMADRFTYIPHLGLLTALVWGLFDLAAKTPAWVDRALKAGGIILLGLFGFFAWRQTGYWKSNFTLYEQTLRVTGPNELAYRNLALAHQRNGDKLRAAEFYSKALEVNPNNADVLNNLANLLQQMGQVEEAKKLYAHASQKPGGGAESLVNLGLMAFEDKDFATAESYFKKALERDARRIKALLGLAQMESSRQNHAAAMSYLETALGQSPLNTEVNYAAGNLQIAQKNYSAARTYYETVLRLEPRHAKAAYNLGNIFFLEKHYEQALHYYELAIATDPNFQLARSQADKARSQISPFFKIDGTTEPKVSKAPKT